MANFLRDIRITNLTVTEQLLASINDFLEERCLSVNKLIDQSELPSEQKTDQRLALSYIIRFDNRGYKLFDPDEAMRYYQQASVVERLLITSSSFLSERTSRQYGTYFEVRLDAGDPNACYIQVSADDRDSVDAVYNGLTEILLKHKNKNGWVRNTWTQLLVQVIGVAVGFVLSLLSAIEISPYLKVENAFFITFIFSFLIFSNTWGYLNQQILWLLNYAFPNVRFVRQKRNTTHWLIQAVVGGVLVAAFLFAFNQIMNWVGNIMGAFISL